jgi:hypothetical protein
MKEKQGGLSDDHELSIVRFEDKDVRRFWDTEAEKWYLSVIDVVGAITGSSIPKRYWTDLKIKLKTEGFELYDKIVQLKFTAKDGKKYATDCTDVETTLRLVQSIPSPKAEPLRQWLARVGYERIEETNDPEKAIDRGVNTYLRKGRSPEWVNQRLRTIEVRKELTQEWKNRGVNEGKDYAELTDILTVGWSGMRTKDYKHHKGLKGQNLRDHMSTLELVLNMLAEASTTEIARTSDAQGINDNRIAAAKGGGIAGNAREQIEKTTGKPVITSGNHLPAPTEKKKLK